jgi:diacylglycerol kinase family enzyme
VAVVAVVAHSGKSLGGGLPQLRRILAGEGVTDPLWHEVSKSRRAPFARVIQGKKFTIRFDHKVRFEVDGGTRPAREKLRVKVRPGSVTACVPPAPRG